MLNTIAFVMLVPLSLGSGLFFPTSCNPDLSMEACNASHIRAAQPFVTALGIVAVINIALLVWNFVDFLAARRESALSIIASRGDRRE